MPLRHLQRALQGKIDIKEALTQAAQLFESYKWGTNNYTDASVTTAKLADASVTATKLAADLSARVEAWHEVGIGGEPAFQNSWVNAGGTQETAAFYKDPFGRVHLKGAVMNGTVSTTIFTLQTGYRPAARQDFGVDANAAYGAIVVSANGNVTQNAGTNVNLKLDDVSFRV